MSIIDIWKNVLNLHGWTGLFAGLLPQVISTTIHSVTLNPFCYFIYNKLMAFSQAHIATKEPKEQAHLVQKSQRMNMLISSTAAHIFSCLLVLPFEAISVHLQASTWTTDPLPRSWNLAIDLFRQYGLRLFYLGILPHTLKHIIYGSIVTYTLIQKSHSSR